MYSVEEFSKRSDLIAEEKEALRNYQDIGNKQHIWSRCIPDTEPHKDCYIINGALRNSDFYDMLSDEDKGTFLSLVSLLDSAIQKSVLLESVLLIKGLDDADWIREYDVDDSYVDKAYGSFTTSIPHAKMYARIQSDGARVFVVRSAEIGTHGVYMGSKEEEILLSKGIQYTINDIIRFSLGEMFDDSEAILYYVSET